MAPEAIAGLLASVAGKSVVRIHDGVAVRYSLLETIRQSATGQLAASGETRSWPAPAVTSAAERL